MVTVVKGLVKVSYSTVDAETIYSMVSTWGAKFNMVILAISSGIIVNLIPNLSSSIVKKDYKGCNDKVIQSLNILLFLLLFHSSLNLSSLHCYRMLYSLPHN